MTAFNFSIQHDRSLEEARAQLQKVVSDVQSKFGTFVQKVEWGPERDNVSLSGTGFQMALRVDPQQVHVSGDVSILGGLLGNSLVGKFKRILGDVFQKRLT